MHACVPWLLGAPSFGLACPCLFSFRLAHLDSIVLTRWSLPTAEARCFRTYPSIGLLELLTPEKGSVILPQAISSLLIHPCPWLKSQQQVCWLVQCPLVVRQSSLPPIEEFLMGVSLEGSPSESCRPVFFLLVSISGPMSKGDLKGHHLQHPI
jgi:hypothetical protein